MAVAFAVEWRSTDQPERDVRILHFTDADGSLHRWRHRVPTIKATHERFHCIILPPARPMETFAKTLFQAVKSHSIQCRLPGPSAAMVLTCLLVAFSLNVIWAYAAQTRLPPSPCQLPLIGNIHQLPAEYQHTTIARWGREFGMSPPE